MQLAAIIRHIQTIPLRYRRRLIALAGPPASGKSSLAKALSEQIPDSAVVPMDGFHLDNSELQAHGLLDRKGAPETFDTKGFKRLIERLATEDSIRYPVFDRGQDRTIADGGQLGPEIETVIVEGNYLLLDAPGWRELMPLWDCTIYLSVPETELRKRLLERWHRHGYAPTEAGAKVEGNDMKNAQLIAAHLLKPHFILEEAALKR